MAGKGMAPKETRQRDRDNKRTTVTWDGTSFWGEDLPDDIPTYDKNGEPTGVLTWHPMTVRWWNGFRNWPVLEHAHPVQWNSLLATALMVNQMWNNGRWDFAAEIRLREAKFGATPADLRSLGYDYELEGDKEDEDDQPKGPGTVTDINARRGRLTEPDAAAAKKTAAAKRATAKKVAAKKAPVKKSTTPRKAPAKKVAATKTTVAKPQARAAVKRPDADDPAPY